MKSKEQLEKEQLDFLDFKRRVEDVQRRFDDADDVVLV